MYIDVKKLQSDRIECSQNLEYLDDIIKNYHYYAQLGKVNNSLAAYKTEFNRNLQILNSIDDQLAQATGPAPIVRQHTGIGNTRTGGVIINKGSGLNSQSSGLNRRNAAEYSGIKKGSSSEEPAYEEPPTQSKAPAQYKQYEEQIAPVIIPKYFLKESSINIVTKNGKYIGTGLPDTKPVDIINVDETFTSTSLLEGKENVLYVKPEEPIELPEMIGIRNLVDSPFSSIRFPSLNGKTIDAATMIFFHVKDILIEHIKFIQNDQTLIADDISDITACLEDKNLPSKDLVIFKKIWDNVKVTVNENKYLLDRGGDHIYFNSSNLDVEMLIAYIREGLNEPIWLRDDTYLGLFEAIKQCKSHGILEIIGKIRFRYYVGKDIIKLVRM